MNEYAHPSFLWNANMVRKTAIDLGETFPGSSQPGREAQDENPPPIFKQADPRSLKPHPQNSAIYGESEDATELIELIRISGWVKPLVVTPTGTIISGHRRCKAVLKLGWESIMVEVREFSDELAELEALLLENASRLKTTEQKVREGEAWKEVETFKAKLRQKASLKNGNHTPVPKNFSEREKGESRNHIAKRVGLGSGLTYEKAALVVGVIDEDTKKGDLVTAQGLRQVLNEKSVDAAHTLAKKSPQERQALAELITNGKAKSLKQAVKMINLNNDPGGNDADSSDPSKPSLAGFSVGDWVEISETAHAYNLIYIGQRGRVEQVLAAEKQISVSIEGLTDKIRFDPHELSLLVRSAPANSVHVGDIVFIRIDAREAASTQQRRWNGFWGKVTLLGEMGSLKVDMGSESLQLFPRDLKPIDAPSAELPQVVERVLRLRFLDLDQVEEKMLDVFQRREWLTPRQLHYLDFMEKFYLHADLHKNDLHQVVQFRGC